MLKILLHQPRVANQMNKLHLLFLYMKISSFSEKTPSHWCQLEESFHSPISLILSPVCVCTSLTSLQQKLEEKIKLFSVHKPQKLFFSGYFFG